MTKYDFIAKYVISRAYLHNTGGLLEHMMNEAGDLNKDIPEELSKIEKGNAYYAQLENEISHAYEIADLLEYYITFDTPQKSTTKTRGKSGTKNK